MEEGSRDMQGQEEDSMKVFKEGISLSINFWWAIRCYVTCTRRDPEAQLSVDSLCDHLFSCFIQSKELNSAQIKLKLKEQLISFLGHPPPPDNSIQQVSDQLVSMYQECLQHDFSSVQIIKEANAHRKRVNKFQMESLPYIQKLRKSNYNMRDLVLKEKLKRLSQSPSCKEKMKKTILLCNRLGIGTRSSSLETFEEEVSKFGMETYLKRKFGMETPSVEIIQETPSVQIIQETNNGCSLMQKQANSSEMDDSNLTNSIRVFKEGVGLLMEDLWARHVFVHKNSGSNPSLMLQQLAEDILFWFTQTIKPISFDYIEWILRNELYPLPVPAKNVIDVTQEVAKKLMVMYEECLQGNFTSVEILREEILSRGICSISCNETTGQSNIDSEIVIG